MHDFQQQKVTTTTNFGTLSALAKDFYMHKECMPNLAKHITPWQVHEHVVKRMQMTFVSDVAGRIIHLLLMLSLHTQ